MYTAGDLGLNPISANNQWTASFAGFPPNQDISYVINGGFSLEGYPPDMQNALDVQIRVDGNTYALVINGLFGSFPVWNSYQAHALADDNGTLHLTLDLWLCQGWTLPIGSPAPLCTIDGTSTFEATLVDTTPWLEAPLCGQ